MVRWAAIFLVSLSFCAGCKHSPREKGLADAPGERDRARDPQRVVLDTELANRFVKADKAGEVIVRIKVGTEGKARQKRPAANIALVLDTSSSMEGTAIEEARRAAQSLLDGLQNGDRLAIVAFGSQTEVVVKSTVVDDKTRARIAGAIGNLRAKGTTDLRGGLSAGWTEVMRHHDPAQIQRIVLLSDGVPNDEAGIVETASQAGTDGIPVTALGLGLDYQETLLGQVAQASGGSLHFVEDETKVAKVFADEVLSFDRLVARSVQLRLAAGPGVEIQQVVGHNQYGAGREVQLGLGDLVEGDARELHVRLRIGPHADGATVELLDAQLHFDDAVVGAGALHRDAFVAVKATEDAGDLEAGRSASVELSAARAFTAAATIRVMERARAGDLAGAYEELDRSEATAKAAANHFDDDELTGLTSDLRDLRTTLPELQRPEKRRTAPAPAAAKHNRRAYSRAYDAIH